MSNMPPEGLIRHVFKGALGVYDFFYPETKPQRAGSHNWGCLFQPIAMETDPAAECNFNSVMEIVRVPCNRIPTVSLCS